MINYDAFSEQHLFSSSDEVHSEKLERDEEKENEPKYIDPFTGAHFKYLDLFERVYDLKQYRKQIDVLLGLDYSTTSTEEMAQSIYKLQKQEIIFKGNRSRKKNVSVFAQISNQLNKMATKSQFEYTEPKLQKRYTHEAVENTCDANSAPQVQRMSLQLQTRNLLYNSNESKHINQLGLSQNSLLQRISQNVKGQINLVPSVFDNQGHQSYKNMRSTSHCEIINFESENKFVQTQAQLQKPILQSRNHNQASIGSYGQIPQTEKKQSHFFQKRHRSLEANKLINPVQEINNEYGDSAQLKQQTMKTEVSRPGSSLLMNAAKQKLKLPEKINLPIVLLKQNLTKKVENPILAYGRVEQKPILIKKQRKESFQRSRPVLRGSILPNSIINLESRPAKFKIERTKSEVAIIQRDTIKPYTYQSKY